MVSKESQSNFTQIDIDLWIILPQNDNVPVLKDAYFANGTIFDLISLESVNVGVPFDGDGEEVNVTVRTIPETTSVTFDTTQGKLIVDKDLIIDNNYTVLINLTDSN